MRLDDASLQKDLLRQRISVHQSKATLVKATADVEAAKLALQSIFPDLIVRTKNSLRVLSL